MLAFISDLSLIASKNEPVPLSVVIPRNCPGESFLRASLLMLTGDRHSGEGIVGQLGAIPLEVIVENDGWPKPLEATPLKSLSPGIVKPKEVG